MREIKVSTGRTNTTTHRAVLAGDEIKRILEDQVCAAAGVTADQDGIAVNVQLSARMGSYAMEYEALVTVTVDHEKQPTAGDA